MTHPQLVELPVSDIQPNPDQPRQTFPEDSLKELAASLQAYGQLQPISVRPNGKGYTIIAGERRWRAAQIAGWANITALVRDNLTEQEAFELSLMENIMREAVNPVEEARAYKRLMEMGMDEEEICRRYGWVRGTVKWKVEVLGCRDDVLHLVSRGTLSWMQGARLAKLSLNGQAKALRVLTSESLDGNEFNALVDGLYLQENSPEMFGMEEVGQSEEARKAGRVARDFLRLAGEAAKQIGDFDDQSIADGLLTEVAAEQKASEIIKALRRIIRAIGRQRGLARATQKTLDSVRVACQDDGNGTGS